MYTADKRAQLEANGEPWPDCECHGRPLSWNRKPAMKDGGHFRCRVDAAEWKQRFRQTRRDAAECLQCGGPLDTETLCRSCADAHADLMARPEQYLDHLFAQTRHRRRIRADEGFQPTGVGFAVFAAQTSNRGA